MEKTGEATKICTRCGYVITSRYLSLNGEDWHSSCVVCDECEGPVFTDETSRFHTQDGKIYCKDCVTLLFQVCADCGQPAKKYVKALGKIWHTFHFKCASCKTILDTYAEVDGAAYCQPCHQRMSAKTFTKAKRRSFGTEKREAAAAAARPAWAPKRTGSTAPKSALDVMHKSWFINGLKKPAQPSSPSQTSSPINTPSSSPSPSPTPGSPSMSPRISRPYSPSPPSTTSPSPTFNASPSPLSPQLQSTQNRPRTNIPPLSSSSNISQNGKSNSWIKNPTPHQQPPQAQEVKTPSWLASRQQQQQTPSSTPQPVRSTTSSSSSKLGVPTAASGFSGARTPQMQHQNGNGAPSYTNITFENVVGNRRSGSFKHEISAPPPHALEGLHLAEILEAILRPMSEDEVGSLAYQAIPLLANVHKNGRLHNNVTHKTIRITPNGTVVLIESEPEEDKVGGSSIKFKAPEDAVTVASDTYSLGVALWTSADYLLDEEEEPALSAEFCDFIGLMTDDEPSKRPPLKTLLPYVEKYKEISAPLLAALIREVERKKVLRKEIQETTVQKQKTLGKQLLVEIQQGVRLKHVDIRSSAPVQRPPTPQEMLCMYIKNFAHDKLRKVDYSALPPKLYKTNPRERLLQSILSGTCLKKALVVAGYDINTLISRVPNHPTYGTTFRDISSLFTVPRVSSQIAQNIATRYSGEPPDVFVSTPTDGGVFFASLVAQIFNRGVIVLQNAGRLPRKMEKHTCGYENLGYVSHALELQLPKGLIKEGTKVVIIDEMLVNGSILEAARVILRETGAKIKEVLCIVELEGFGGRLKTKAFDCNVHSMYVFNDNPPLYPEKPENTRPGRNRE